MLPYESGAFLFSSYKGCCALSHILYQKKVNQNDWFSIFTYKILAVCFYEVSLFFEILPCNSYRGLPLFITLDVAWGESYCIMLIKHTCKKKVGANVMEKSENDGQFT